MTKLLLDMFSDAALYSLMWFVVTTAVLFVGVQVLSK
jgi:hypothetical protein